MATRAAKALMDGTARQRMADATAALVERFGVELPEPRGVIRDPDLARIAEIEDTALLLERLAVAAKEADSGRKTLTEHTGGQAAEPQPAGQQAKARTKGR